ncbi:hypothetical protein ARMGADRAFT_434044 [Armillaria gallica]|uniref:Uncharacterized protein n=1 Tax=Armillaria gallica TaxID=47427 RepID=A0A2H3CYQ1_ARMGA|nr:hypothetical protein ARMGADRAFT_434044 [Armillaria gallica]
MRSRTYTRQARRCGSTSCLARRLDVSGRLTRTSFFGLIRLFSLLLSYTLRFAAVLFHRLVSPSNVTPCSSGINEYTSSILLPLGINAQYQDTNLKVALLANQ